MTLPLATRAAVRTQQRRYCASHPQAVEAIRAVGFYHLFGRRGALAYVITSGVPYPLYRLARQLDALHQGERA